MGVVGVGRRDPMPLTRQLGTSWLSLQRCNSFDIPNCAGCISKKKTAKNGQLPKILLQRTIRKLLFQGRLGLLEDRLRNDRNRPAKSQH